MLYVKPFVLFVASKKTGFISRVGVDADSERERRQHEQRSPARSRREMSLSPVRNYQRSHSPQKSPSKYSRDPHQ